MNHKDLTKTVYSIGWKKTQDIFKLHQEKELSGLFNETWSKKQDSMHNQYLELWKQANQKNLIIDELPFGYPTNGSSEAIFMQLTHLNSQGKRLVVFDGEYEGYSMFAKNIKMPILFVNRENIQWNLIDCKNDVFFTSQPSSIDGNLWNGFNDFIRDTASRGIDVYVDLAYIGLFPHREIELQYYNVKGIFFSLSKTFGVYYHRIGGCFLKEENPLLWPMLWFKNLNSISYGESLLSSLSNGEFSSTFIEIKDKQKKICKELSEKEQILFKPSDVPFIATIEYNENIEWMKLLQRDNHSKELRVCISKILEQSLLEISMKNIQTILPDEMDVFFTSFWQSKEFQNLNETHPYFKLWLNKLKEAPIYFFDLSHEKGKYHLTSHMRLIARRDYGENKLLNDLYYFHELTHCAEFSPTTNNDYSIWKEKLNDNELYASIVSEVLIYYFCPSIIGKTFNPLWANRFYSIDKINRELHKDEFGLYITNDEKCYSKNKNFNFLNFNQIELWPQSIQKIYQRRKELRDIINSSVLDNDEATITEYNIPRYKWIEKWSNHFRKIDDSLIALIHKKINSNEYLNVMYQNCDEFSRPFFPK